MYPEMFASEVAIKEVMLSRSPFLSLMADMDPDDREWESNLRGEGALLEGLVMPRDVYGFYQFAVQNALNFGETAGVFPITMGEKERKEMAFALVLAGYEIGAESSIGLFVSGIGKSVSRLSQVEAVLDPGWCLGAIMNGIELKTKLFESVPQFAPGFAVSVPIETSPVALSVSKN
jgi:hypothetical protein